MGESSVAQLVEQQTQKIQWLRWHLNKDLQGYPNKSTSLIKYDTKENEYKFKTENSVAQVGFE